MMKFVILQVLLLPLDFCNVSDYIGHMAGRNLTWSSGVAFIKYS